MGEGRAAAGNRRAPSLTPQPLQPPKSISSSPLSILMNRKGSWDPLRQQPWRLNPPKEQIPKQLALQGSAGAGGGSTFLGGCKALYWDCFPA